MTNTPVDPIVEMNINGVWTDITADVRLDSAASGGSIDITRGVPNEGSDTEPSQVSMVLNNAGGKYSPANPFSPYFGLLRRNMQTRIGTDRRRDDFTRTAVDGWGRTNTRVTPELQTVLGDRWRTLGNTTLCDVNGSAATIQSTTGYTAQTIGTYGDVDVLTKVRVSNLTSEFGIMLRLKPTELTTDPGDFENGLNGWTVTTGTSTLAVSTTQSHAGTSSALLTVAGSPTTVGARGTNSAVVPGRSCRGRIWCRSSVSLTVTAQIDWYDISNALISSSTNTLALTANTWAVVEVSGNAPDAAVTAQLGPQLTGSPANGTLLFIDDVDFQDYGDLELLSAYITPGDSTLRTGRVTLGGGATSQSTPLPFTLTINTDIWMRAQMTGLRSRVKIWLDGSPEPTLYNWRTYGTYENGAVPINRIPATGSVGLFAKDGTALVTFDSVEINQWRAHVEISELPPRYDLSRRDRWVPVAARGILRRLGQGRKSLESAVTLQLATYTGAGSWIPLETIDSTSPTVGNRIVGAPAAVANTLSQGSIDRDGPFIAPGLGGCVTFDDTTSSLSIRTKPGIAAGDWNFLSFWRVPSTVGADSVIFTVSSTGTGKRFVVTLLTTNVVRVDVLDGDGSVISTANAGFYFAPNNPIGCWMSTNLDVSASGGTVAWALNFHNPADSVFYTINNTYSGSVGTFTEAKFVSTAAVVSAGNLQVAQCMHFPGDLPFVTTDFSRAAYAYIGEAASSRLLRLGINAGLNITTIGPSPVSKPMGAQEQDTLLNLLKDCIDVDDSLLLEERDSFGLCMFTREAIWNQRLTTLDIDLGHLSPPLEATYDDQNTRNDVIVSRPNGSFSRSVQLTGPLNVSAPEDDPINGVGTYDEAPEINFATDDQTRSAANWRRSKGTIDEPRYPGLTADLTASAYQNSPALTAEVLSKDAGTMLSLVNPEVSYNPSIQVVRSYTEHLDQYVRTLTFNTQPGALWQVGQVGRVSMRLATRYQTTGATFVSGTDTRMTAVRAAPGGLFVQVVDDPPSFPFEIEVSGVRLMVEATGNVLNTNPYFDTDLSGWVSSGSTTLYRDRYLNQYKEGVASMRITATGAVTSGAEVTQAAAPAVVAATDYLISGWVRTNVALADVRLAVDWYQANGTTLISTTLPTAIGTGINTWVFFSAVVTSPALAAFARPKPRAVYLASGNLLWVDSVRLMPVSSYSASPQTLTVRQTPTNGVSGKTIPSGSPITVVQPWRVAF